MLEFGKDSRAFLAFEKNFRHPFAKFLPNTLALQKKTSSPTDCMQAEKPLISIVSPVYKAEEIINEPINMSNAKKVVITQSNYIPWKGYFDSIALADEFILYDDVQYTRRDWRNRNLIKTSQGLQWLSIPVEVKGNFYQKIREIRVCSSNWVTNHLKSIKNNYSKARHFKSFFPVIEELYLKAERLELLSEINYLFLRGISDILGINTPIKFCWDYDYSSDDKNLRLIEICKSAGATNYYTGEAAKNYINTDLFEQHGINIHWLNNNGYLEYPQLYPPFVHGVSILDLLLNTGEQSRQYLKY